MTLQNRMLPPAAASVSRAEEEIAELAHDLRNMLSCALLHLEMLHGSVAAGGQSRVDKSIAALERARWTLQQAVDAADLHATLKLTAFDLPDLARAVAAEMSVRGGVEIEVAVDGGIDGRILSCPARFTRILHNLLFNAVAVSRPDGRRITVSVRRATDGAFEVAVADQGPGLPEEVRSRLGDRRLPSRSGGGLGLAAAVRMADLLGGGLSVRCSGSVGTVIALTLRDLAPGGPAAAEGKPARWGRP